MNREDFERNGGPKSASLSNAYLRKAVGLDLAGQIADGLELPRETVFRESGFLPEKDTVDDEEAKIFIDLLNGIEDPEKRKETFDMVTALIRIELGQQAGTWMADERGRLWVFLHE